MSAKIRVLHMIGSLGIGGSQAFVMNLYRKMDRNQIQFDFIADSRDNAYYAREIEELGGKIFYFPKFNGTNYFKIKSTWKNFFSDHKEYKILHSHVRSYASLYIPIARSYGVKTIIHSHTTSNGSGIASIAKAILQYPLRYQADYFVGCSAEAGKWLFGKKVVESNRYFAIPNAIDAEAYRFNPDIRRKYRAELGLCDETTYIHVGRFHPAKNHAFLLNLFAQIHKQNEHTKLILVGDGDLRNEIESQIRTLQIESAVILTGNRSDVANLLQAADCFLLPSRWEGLPVVAVEAQAAGLPCFLSETITRDINISPLVHYVSIDNGPEPWLQALRDADTSRKNVLSQIKDAGFDVNSTVAWLQDFYSGLIGSNGQAECSVV